PVAEADDARRLLRVVLADDELVRSPGDREPRRTGPVDLLDGVTSAVRPGAGDVGAHSAPRAPHRRKRQADHAAVLDEREGCLGRHTVAAAGASRARSGPGGGASV